MGSFTALLKNRKYIGEYKYQDVVIQNGVPAIISEDLFNRVQERMDKSKRAPARTKAEEEYLLTTKLFCGDCERMMIGESGKSSTGRIYYYYKCGGAKRRSGCKRKAVKKDWIERVAVVMTVNRVLQDDEIDRISDKLVALQERENTALPALQQQLEETEKAIDNLLTAIQQGILTKSTKKRMNDLESQKESLEISILQAELKKPKYTKEQVVTWISQFRYGDVNSKEYQKRMIDIFLNSIYVKDDRLIITFNFQGGTQTITLAEIEAALGSDMVSGSPPKSGKSGQKRVFPNFFMRCVTHMPALSLTRNS